MTRLAVVSGAALGSVFAVTMLRDQAVAIGISGPQFAVGCVVAALVSLSFTAIELNFYSRSRMWLTALCIALAAFFAAISAARICYMTGTSLLDPIWVGALLIATSLQTGVSLAKKWFGAGRERVAGKV